jgi:hypothetical protein
MVVSGRIEAGIQFPCFLGRPVHGSATTERSNHAANHQRRRVEHEDPAQSEATRSSDGERRGGRRGLAGEFGHPRRSHGQAAEVTARSASGPHLVLRRQHAARSAPGPPRRWHGQDGVPPPGRLLDPVALVWHCPDDQTPVTHSRTFRPTEPRFGSEWRRAEVG